MDEVATLHYAFNEINWLNNRFLDRCIGKRVAIDNRHDHPIWPPGMSFLDISKICGLYMTQKPGIFMTNNYNRVHMDSTWNVTISAAEDWKPAIPLYGKRWRTF